MSQFDALAKAVTNKKIEPSAEVKEVKKTASSPPSKPPKKSPAPVGKSSDDSFLQVGAYIKKETYIKVKKALLDEPQKTNFSDLVENLLQDWISRKK